MQFLKLIETRLKQNLSIWDFGLVKSIGLVFGALVGAFYSDFIKSNYIIFIVLLVLIGMRVGYKLMIKK